jgi:hypothetical protein
MVDVDDGSLLAARLAYEAANETGTRTRPSVADVLRAARDLYEQAPSHAPEPGWPQPGTVCAVTAIDRAVAISRAVGGANTVAAAVLDARARGSLMDAAGRDSLVAWNAENSTETVLAAFDKAIRDADGS